MKKTMNAMHSKSSTDASDAPETRQTTPTTTGARRMLTRRLGFALALSCLTVGVAAAGCNGILGGDDDAAASGGCPDDLEFFQKNVWEPIVSQKCAICHSDQGVAKGTRMVFDTSGSPEALESNFSTIRSIAAVQDKGESVLLLRPTGRFPAGHGGGTVIEFNSPDYRTMATFVARVNEGKNCDAKPASCEPGVVAGRRVLRMLSRVEYDRTMKDLLGLDASTYQLAMDAKVNGFDNNADALRASSLLVEQLRGAAEDIAEKVGAAPGSLLPCTPQSGDAACASQFIDAFGRKAFRRTLSPEEHERYAGLFQSISSGEDFIAGIQAVIAGMLQSPNFLYRPEIGEQTAQGDFQLTPFEVASELSYLIWGTMPDDALLQKAESGGFATAEDIAAEVDRMIADPKMDANFASFMEQWLDIRKLAGASKDGMAYPEFDEALKQELFKETAAFSRHVLREGSGSMAELFTANYTMANDDLASFYGLQASGGTPDADGYKEVDLTGTGRVGLLTLGSVLTTHARAAESSPIHRGKFVRERLLCQHLSLPPAGLNIVPPGLDPTKSTRDRFASHSSDPVCQGCHELIDPIGFGFEHFDGIGRYREKEGDVPIDVRGEIVQAATSNGEFDGIEELATKLGSSPEVEECFTLQWLRFGFGVEDQAELSCMAGQVSEKLTGEQLTVPALIKAIATSSRFLKRVPDGAAVPVDPTTSSSSSGAGGGGPVGAGATSSSSATTSSAAGGDPPPTQELGVQEIQTSMWDTGGCERVVVTNNGSSNVTWEITLTPDGAIQNVYNAVATPAGASTKFKGVDFNGNLAPAATAEFGFCWQR